MGIAWEEMTSMKAKMENLESENKILKNVLHALIEMNVVTEEQIEKLKKEAT